jgi:hypothetical protein
MKSYTAAPPDVLRIDEKNLREHYIFNICGVITTTNHKTNGIFLPSDDRRNYVAWSECDKHQFCPEYWTAFYSWYHNSGFENIAAYLHGLSLKDFDPKAPPPKTAAFWEIVNSSRSPENAELADALDALKNPDVVTLAQVTDTVSISVVHCDPSPETLCGIAAPRYSR